MTVRILSALFLLVISAPFSMAADSIVEKANNLLSSKATGRDAVGFLHFGTDYKNHTLSGSGGVNGRDGRKIPGAFYLEYTYVWQGAFGGPGKTTLSYFFDGNGRFTHTQVDRTDAILSPPFSSANLTIAVLGAAVGKALEDDMSAAQKKLLQQVIRDADAKSLFELSVAVKLAVAR